MPAPEIGTVVINGHKYRRQIVRVAEVTFDGSTCIVPLADLIDVLGEGEAYMVRITTMSKAKFDRLEEFTGW